MGDRACDRCTVARVGHGPCRPTKEQEKERDAERDRPSPHPRAPHGGATGLDEREGRVARAVERSWHGELAEEPLASQPFRAPPEPDPLPRRDGESSGGGAG